MSQVSGILPHKLRSLLPLAGCKVRRCMQAVNEQNNGKRVISRGRELSRGAESHRLLQLAIIQQSEIRSLKSGDRLARLVRHRDVETDESFNADRFMRRFLARLHLSCIG